MLSTKDFPLSIFKSQKQHIKEHKINTHGFWWYIEVLWSKKMSLCEQVIIILQNYNPEPYANGPEGCPVLFNWSLWNQKRTFILKSVHTEK